MFKRRIIEATRRLIWKLVGRDVLILSPQLAINYVSEDSIFISKTTNSRQIHSLNYLPIKYNYHTDADWKVLYEIRGATSGKLNWNLSTPRDGIFATTETPVNLPTTIEVWVKDNELYFNGKRLAIVAGKTLPLTTPVLIADFFFATKDGSMLRRRTAHRVRVDTVDLIDSNYYEGQVYGDYERDAQSVPREIFDSLKKYISTKGRFLEIGCATGLTVAYAAKEGFEAEGVDVSEWAVEQANKRSAGKCRVLNFDNASRTDFDGCYDVIVMHSVIEHLEEPEKAIQLLFDLCRPGGLVYIQTLNANSLMHALMNKDWGGYSDPTHKSPWISSEWLADISQQAGFESVSMKRYHLWNDNIYDEVWNALNKAFQLSPLSVLLEDGYGDAVELIARRPSS